MKAVVMCGGVGSRLRPVTENIPKPLVKVVNRPVLDIVIEKLIESGISEIYLSLGYMANEIIEYCESRKYDAQINFCEEAVPLGTAGGVKNCIQKSDEDIIIVSGDNVFDFDINKIADYHFSSDADITVCGYEVSDPREYGVIMKDDDGSIISFIEKPTWELSDSFLINTGLYIIKGKILDMIPSGKFYDFSNDLFPEIFSIDMRFMCYHAKGFWGDMGEFPALRQVSRDILDGKFREFHFTDRLYLEDTVLENGTIIRAPSVIGEGFSGNNGVVVGPYCVMGENISVGKNSVIEDAIIGNGTRISESCDIKNAVISENVRILSNCYIDENAVLAYGCVIGRFTRIFAGSKIWPGRKIDDESFISKDMFYETPDRISFDIFGLSGKINTGISLSDAVKIGQAFSSISTIDKIGVGADGSHGARIFTDAVSSGLRACGGLVYDFGEMAKVQSYFYSAYCSLDAFIYISLSGDVISFSFYGKYGLPFNSSLARNINNNYRFSSFVFSLTENYKEVFNMSLFPTVYKSYAVKMCGSICYPAEIITETENVILKEILSDVFSKNKSNQKNSILQILINRNGTDAYVVENEKFYSSERILILLCEIEFASGRDVIIPEDAPSIIDDNASKYGRRAYRVFECAKNDIELDNSFILDSLWCFDPVLMCAKLVGIMSSLRINLENLFEKSGEFSLRKSVIELDSKASEIRRMIAESGAVKHDNDTYFVISNRKGKARVRQLGNSNRVRILAESYDMETAKELSVFVAEKIKNTDIDKRV